MHGAFAWAIATVLTRWYESVVCSTYEREDESVLEEELEKVGVRPLETIVANGLHLVLRETR